MGYLIASGGTVVLHSLGLTFKIMLVLSRRHAGVDENFLDRASGRNGLRQWLGNNNRAGIGLITGNLPNFRLALSGKVRNANFFGVHA